MSSARPVTSKARGICRYYTTPQGCFAGRTCKFLHGKEEKITPYDKSKTCKFYAAGYCKRGAKCWFVHAQPDASSSGFAAVEVPDTDEYEHICCICYEEPVTYGLLGGCSHVFCLECIREWRDPHGKGVDVVGSGVTKMCPLCRAPSKFVTPSSLFYKDTDARKALAIEQYKASMARVPCRHFQRSPSYSRYCPFGNDCFYQHRNEDGTTHEFPMGVDYYMKHKSQRRYDDFFGPFDQLVEPVVLDIHAAIDAIRANLPEFLDDEEDGALSDNLHVAEEEIARNETLLSRLADHFMTFILDGGEPPQSSGPSLAPSSPPALQLASPELEEFVSSTPISHDFFDFASYNDLVHESNQPAPEPSSLSPTLGLIPTPDVPLHPSLLDDSTASDYGAGDIIEADIDTLAIPSDSSEPIEPSEVVSHAEVSTISVEEVSAQHSANEQVEEAAKPYEPVHDVDPPFLTDGRGKVVWSSTTAPQPRRARTLPSPTAPVPQHKPRRVEIEPSDSSE